jgi:hypothetical protein
MTNSRGRPLFSAPVRVAFGSGQLPRQPAMLPRTPGQRLQPHRLYPLNLMRWGADERRLLCARGFHLLVYA